MHIFDLQKLVINKVNKIMDSFKQIYHYNFIAIIQEYNSHYYLCGPIKINNKFQFPQFKRMNFENLINDEI